MRNLLNTILAQKEVKEVEREIEQSFDRAKIVSNNILCFAYGMNSAFDTIEKTTLLKKQTSKDPDDEAIYRMYMTTTRRIIQMISYYEGFNQRLNDYQNTLERLKNEVDLLSGEERKKKIDELWEYMTTLPFNLELLINEANSKLNISKMKNGLQK